MRREVDRAVDEPDLRDMRNNHQLLLNLSRELTRVAHIKVCPTNINDEERPRRWIRVRLDLRVQLLRGDVSWRGRRRGEGGVPGLVRVGHRRVREGEVEMR
jgi:hypothetical protein